MNEPEFECLAQKLEDTNFRPIDWKRSDVQLLLKYFFSHGRNRKNPLVLKPDALFGGDHLMPEKEYKEFDIDIAHTVKVDCTEVILSWRLPLLEEQVGTFSRLNYLRPCDDTKRRLWDYLTFYRQAYACLSCRHLSLFRTHTDKNALLSDKMPCIEYKKKRKNNYLFLIATIPKEIQVDLIKSEELHTQDLWECINHI